MRLLVPFHLIDTTVRFKESHHSLIPVLLIHILKVTLEAMLIECMALLLCALLKKVRLAAVLAVQFLWEMAVR